MRRGISQAHHRAKNLNQQPLLYMIKTIEHWFKMVPAPPEVRETVKSMIEVLGYKTLRLDILTMRAML